MHVRLSGLASVKLGRVVASVNLEGIDVFNTIWSMTSVNLEGMHANKTI